MNENTAKAIASVALCACAAYTAACEYGEIMCIFALVLVCAIWID